MKKGGLIYISKTIYHNENTDNEQTTIYLHPEIMRWFKMVFTPITYIKERVKKWQEKNFI